MNSVQTPSSVRQGKLSHIRQPASPLNKLKNQDVSPASDRGSLHFSGLSADHIARLQHSILDLDGNTFTPAQFVWYLEIALNLSQKDRLVNAKLFDNLGRWDNASKEKLYKALRSLQNLGVIWIQRDGPTEYLNDWGITAQGRALVDHIRKDLSANQDFSTYMPPSILLRYELLSTAKHRRTTYDFLSDIENYVNNKPVPSFTAEELANHYGISNIGERNALSAAIRCCFQNRWLEEGLTYHNSSDRLVQSWTLTNPGRDILRSPRPAELTEKALKAASPQAPSPTVPLQTASTPQKAEPSSIDRFKALLSEGKEGVSGWKILQKIHQYETSRSSLSAFFSAAGFSEKTLMQALGFKDVHSLRYQLGNLQQAGFLTGDTYRWHFSEAGRAALKEADPAKACKITNADYVTMLDQEIALLEDEKRKQSVALNEISAQITEAPAALAEHQSKYNTLRQQAITAYDAMAQETNTHLKGRKQLEVSDLLFKLKMAEQEVTELTEAHARKNESFQRGKAVYLTILSKLNGRILSLNQLRIKLKNTDDLDASARLATSLIEALKSRENTSGSMPWLMDKATDHLSQIELGSDSRLSELDKDVNPVADEILRKQELDDAILALRREKQIQDDRAPSSTTITKTQSS